MDPFNMDLDLEDDLEDVNGRPFQGTFLPSTVFEQLPIPIPPRTPSPSKYPRLEREASELAQDDVDILGEESVSTYPAYIHSGANNQGGESESDKGTGDPFDFSFSGPIEDLQSSILTLRPSKSSSKGKERMLDPEDFFNAFPLSVQSPAFATSASSSKSIPPSSSERSVQQTRFSPPSSLSSSLSNSGSIAGTSFGTQSSFPITRNRGYEDDRAPQPESPAEDKGQDHHIESLPSPTSPQANSSSCESEYPPSFVSSAGSGPSAPFSYLSSDERSFWDRYEPEKMGDNPFDQIAPQQEHAMFDFSAFSPSFEGADTEADMFGKPWSASHPPRDRHEDVSNVDLEQEERLGAEETLREDVGTSTGGALGVTGITPRPSRVSTPLPLHAPTPHDMSEAMDVDVSGRDHTHVHEHPASAPVTSSASFGSPAVWTDSSGASAGGSVSATATDATPGRGVTDQPNVTADVLEQHSRSVPQTGTGRDDPIFLSPSTSTSTSASTSNQSIGLAQLELDAQRYVNTSTNVNAAEQIHPPYTQHSLSTSSLSAMSSNSGSGSNKSLRMKINLKNLRTKSSLGIKRIKELGRSGSSLAMSNGTSADVNAAYLVVEGTSASGSSSSSSSSANPTATIDASGKDRTNTQTLFRRVLRKRSHRLSEKDRSHSSPIPISALVQAHARPDITEARCAPRSLMQSACTSAAASSLAVDREDLRDSVDVGVDADIDAKEGITADLTALVLPKPVSTFESRLPMEVKMEVMKCLLYLHEVDGECSDLLVEGDDSIWMGRMKGCRELVRLSVVSKSWTRLVTSPSLWDTLILGGIPFRAVPMSAPPSSSSLSVRGCSHAGICTEGERIIARMMQLAGPYLRTLSYSGYPSHTPSTGHHRCFDFGSPPTTLLTTLILRGCSVDGPGNAHLREVLKESPRLRRLDLRGVEDVSFLGDADTTFALDKSCPKLLSLDLSGCNHCFPVMDATSDKPDPEMGLEFILSLSKLRVLRLAGFEGVGYLCPSIGRRLRRLEVLDLSGCDLDDEDVASLVDVIQDEGNQDWDEDVYETVLLKPSDAVLSTPSSSIRTTYVRRVTRLRHLSLSSNPDLTDAACAALAYSVPQLEFLELGGIGEGLQDEGLVRLLRTTKKLRRIDLEDAESIGDIVLDALISPPQPDAPIQPASSSPILSSQISHLHLSHCNLLTTAGLLTLLKSSPKLTFLALDNTPVSQTVLKEFVKLTRRRHIPNAELVAIDCRSVGESLVKDFLSNAIVRTRGGFRGVEGRGLGYFDWATWERSSSSPPSSPSTSSPLSSPSASLILGAPFITSSSKTSGSSSKLGPQHDELDPSRIVFKSFWSWGTVDSVRSMIDKEKKEREKEAERKRKRIAKAAAKANGSGSITPRWLTIGRRTKSASPVGGVGAGEGEGSDTPGEGRRQYGLVQLDGDPNLVDWDDRGCVLM